MRRSKFEPQFWLISWCIALGLGLRAFLVWQRDFWEDELWSVYLSHQIPNWWSQLLHPIDDRPPLYYLWIKLLLTISEEPIWLRFPSWLWAAVALFWLWKLTWLRDKWWSACVLAAACFSPFIIQFSWEVRGYSFLMLVAVAQFALALSWFEKIKTQGVSGAMPTKKWLLWWFLWTTSGFANNYAFMPFWFSFWAAVWFMLVPIWRQNWQLAAQVFWRQVLVFLPVLAFSAWYLWQGQYQTIVDTTGWIAVPSWRTVAIIVSDLFGYTNLLISDLTSRYAGNNWTQVGFSWLLGLFLLAGGVWFLRRQNSSIASTQRFVVGLMLLTLTMNLALILLQSIASPTSVFLQRYFAPVSVVVAVGFGTILAGWIQQIPRDARMWWLWLSVICISAFEVKIFLSHNDIQLSTSLRETPYRTMLRYVSDQYEPGDQILFSNVQKQTLFMPYYFGDERFRAARELEYYLLDDAVSPSVEPNKRLWYVFKGKLSSSEESYLYAMKLLSELSPNATASAVCKSQFEEVYQNNTFVIMVCALNTHWPTQRPDEEY